MLTYFMFLLAYTNIGSCIDSPALPFKLTAKILFVGTPNYLYPFCYFSYKNGWLYTQESISFWCAPYAERLLFL